MQQRYSSRFRLTMFGMAAVILCMAAAMLGNANSVLASDDKDQAPGANTYSGVITDSVCGARHTKFPDLDAVRCTRECVRTGAKYTLINGDKVYFLQGDFAELAQFAGQRAWVTGTLQGETIKITTINSPHQ